LIYASLGLGGDIPLLLNACWTTFTLIGNTWTALYIDHFGRRRFMLIGACGCVVSLIFLAALTASFLDTSNKAGLRAAIFFIWFYIIWWCFFIDATQYVYVSEIFPNHLRPAGVALGLSAFYLASEVTLVAAPVALNKIGWKFYLVLIIPSSVVSVSSLRDLQSLFLEEKYCERLTISQYIVIIYLFFPETKGRTLEEIGHVFGDDVHVAHNWYNASEDEKAKLEMQALEETKGGKVSERVAVNMNTDEITAAEESNGDADKATTSMSEDAAKA
jgi:MFS family permease